jgi:hypothetical protein
VYHLIWAACMWFVHQLSPEALLVHHPIRAAVRILSSSPSLASSPLSVVLMDALLVSERLGEISFVGVDRGAVVRSMNWTRVDVDSAGVCSIGNHLFVEKECCK